MSHDTDVLVLGGGVVGICSSYYLHEKGQKVALVDMGEIGSGSSYGNAGLVVPSHVIPLAAPGVIAKAIRWMFNPESPFYLKPRLDFEFMVWLWRFWRSCNQRRMREAMPVLRDLGLASLKRYEELAALPLPDFGLAKRGLLAIYDTEAGLRDGIEEAHLLREAGLEARELDGAGVRALEPRVRANVLGGVYHPLDAHLDPARFVRGLAAHIQEKGVAIHPRTEILGFEVSGRRITGVETTRGRFTAREVVLAAGAWSPGVVRGLRLKLPIQAAKGYSITYRKPENSPEIPLILSETKVAVTPMPGTLRFGGTLELAGINLAINRRRVQAILRAVPRYLTGLDPDRLELFEIWRGLRPCTPDGLPFLGRPWAYDNLIIAAGHAMIGVSLGPVTGEIVSQIVAREKPSVDLSLLDVDRFR